MKIIVDAMSGDNAPDAIIEGAVMATEAQELEIILTGRGEDILRSLEKLGLKELPRGIEIANATEVIEMDEDPTTAIRRKKDSSLAIGLTMLRDGLGDAMVYAGSTGALLSGATLIVKRVRGIRRAALAPFVPNREGGFILLDCGANVECTPEYLLQFAFMGSYYAEGTLKLKSPRVGLLNNGTEETKGTSLQIKTYALLKKAGEDGALNFVGNVEAKEAMLGACDVLVCDGFSGNIFLKGIEGAASFLMSELRGIYSTSTGTKISALMIKKHIRKLRDKMNPDSTGGTALLGISKPVLKAHGASGAVAICNAIQQAAFAVTADPSDRLRENIEQMKAYCDEYGAEEEV